MQATVTSYKLLKKIKDGKFDEEKLQQYILLLQPGARDLQVGVIDSEDNRIIFFEDYVFGDLKDNDEWLVHFKGLFDSHEILTAGFWKEVRIGVKNNKFVQVPVSLFVESAKEDYLRFNAPLDTENELVLHCNSNTTDAVTVFAVNRLQYQWLTGLYPSSALRYVHQSSVLIAGALGYSPSQAGTPLYVYIDRFKLHILYVQSGKLLYYNQFAIKQFSDYVKYIMLVMKAMQLNQATSQVVLWGYIGKNSPHYQEFVKYIRNVTFGNRPRHLKFGYLFDEVQEHHFFDLFSLNLIEGWRA